MHSKRSNLLSVSNLSKKYCEFNLNGISFSLEEGTITGLIGPNGSGKSTTMKLILGIITRDSGKIQFKNQEVLDIGKTYKQNIGYVGEAIDFFPDSKLKDIKNFYMMFYPQWNEPYFDKLIYKFNLNINSKMKELSKGMKVKFYLSLCLSHNPALLLMDEPTSGLDPLVRNDVLKLLKDYVDENNASVLFSSHITEDMEKIADQLIFMYKGNIKYKGTPSEVASKGFNISSYLENLICSLNEGDTVCID